MCAETHTTRNSAFRKVISSCMRIVLRGKGTRLRLRLQGGLLTLITVNLTDDAAIDY